MTRSDPPGGGCSTIPGSTPAGGHTTPSDSDKLRLRFPPEPVVSPPTAGAFRSSTPGGQFNRPSLVNGGEVIGPRGAPGVCGFCPKADVTSDRRCHQKLGRDSRSSRHPHPLSRGSFEHLLFPPSPDWREDVNNPPARGPRIGDVAHARHSLRARRFARWLRRSRNAAAVLEFWRSLQLILRHAEHGVVRVSLLGSGRGLCRQTHAA